MDFGGGCVEGFGFVGCQAYFDNAFDTGSTKLDGDADEQIVDAVLAREIGGTREDTLLVTNDGFDHFGDGCGGCVIGAARFQMTDNFGTAVTSPLNDPVDRALIEKL